MGDGLEAKAGIGASSVSGKIGKSEFCGVNDGMTAWIPSNFGEENMMS